MNAWAAQKIAGAGDDFDSRHVPQPPPPPPLCRRSARCTHGRKRTMLNAVRRKIKGEARNHRLPAAEVGVTPRSDRSWIAALGMVTFALLAATC